MQARLRAASSYDALVSFWAVAGADPLWLPPPPVPWPADEGLSKQLSSRGYTLLCASHAADLSNGCPAYFLAIRSGGMQCHVSKGRILLLKAPLH